MVNPLKHHDMGIAQAAPLSPRTNPTKAFAIASEVERSHLDSLEHRFQVEVSCKSVGLVDSVGELLNDA
jgi:hypothetical protein